MADNSTTENPNEQKDKVEEQPKSSILEEAIKGTQRGLLNTANMLAYGAPALAKNAINYGKVAYDVNKARLLDEQISETEKLPLDTTQEEKWYKYWEQQAQDIPAAVPTYKDINSARDLALYAAAGAGEQLPNLVFTVGSGVGGANIARIAASKSIQALAKKGGMEIAEKEASRVLAKGALIGASAAGYTQNAPETYMNMLQKGEDHPMEAAFIGAWKTTFDNLGEMRLVRKLLGSAASDVVGKAAFKTGTSKLVKEGVKQGLIEAPTEMAQEALDIFGEIYVGVNKDLFSEENKNRMIDSGLKAFVAGGIMGAGVQGLSRSDAYATNTPIPTNKTPTSGKRETSFEEEVIGEVPKTPVADPEAPIFKVKDRVITAVEGSSNVIDDTITQPVYVDDAVISAFSNSGVKVGSLSNLSLDQVNNVMADISSIQDETYKEVHHDPAQVNPERVQAIKAGKRTDTDFIVGDGEIVVGAIVDTETPMWHPATKIKVNNSNLLDEAVTQQKESKKPKQAKPLHKVISESPILSKSASPVVNLKPRYAGKSVDFPSNVEKAIYTYRPNLPEHSNLGTWLRDTTGLSEQQIADAKQGIVNELKRQKQDNPSLPSFKVPEVLLGGKVAQLRQMVQTPAFGNLHDDLYMPYKIDQTLTGMPLSPTMRMKYSDMVQSIESEIARIAGKGIEFKPFSSIKLDLHNNPVLGVSYSNMIAVALNENTVEGVPETAYHEMYHTLEEIGAFTDEEIALADSRTDALKAYMDSDNYLSQFDFDQMAATLQGRKELRANAFGKCATRYLKNKQELNKVPFVFRSIYKKALSVLDGIKRVVRRNDVKSLDDIFMPVFEGKKAKDMLHDAICEKRTASLRRMAEAHQQHLHDTRTFKEFEGDLDKAIDDSNEKLKSFGGIGFYTRYLESASSVADRYPVMGVLYSIVQGKMSQSSILAHRYNDSMPLLNEAGNETISNIHNLLDMLRASDQRVKFNEEGKAEYERDGKIIRLNSEASALLKEAIDAYGLVREDYRNMLLQEGLREYPGLTKDSSIGDIRKVAESLKEDGRTVGKGERLDKLADVLQELDSMKGKAYVPHTRFGDFGITVKNSAGEQVAFFTVERGKYRNLFDEDSLKKMVDGLQKYANNPEYTILGEGGKPVKSLDVNSINPFFMNVDSIRNNIDPKLVNLDMLSAFLQNDKIDQEAFKEVKQQIIDDIIEKGFKKRFSVSDNIDGYSKDWVRVRNSYFTGAAHFIPGIEYSRKLSAFKAAKKRIYDPKLQKYADTFLEYTNSPQEDQQSMRTFNYLWAMGGNLSTAVLQFATLPTFTLPLMNRYNPDTVGNAARLAKWTARIAQISDDLKVEQGAVILSFGQPEKVAKMVEKGYLSRAQGDYLIKMHERGMLRSQLAQESLSTRNLESKDPVKRAWAKITAGLSTPMQIAEQSSRFASHMAIFETLEKNPDALRRAKEYLSTNSRYQFQVKENMDIGDIGNITMFGIDEVHGVFGKIGRPTVYKSVGGSFFFPFMTYPHQMIENMIKSVAHKGVEGKRQVMAALLMLLFMGGLNALPGYELIKSTVEALIKAGWGIDEDLDYLLREKITDATGDAIYGKLLTQGIFNAALGLDLSKRFALNVPGQDLLASALGNKPLSIGSIGVPGTILSGIGTALDEYRSGGSPLTIAASLIPNAQAKPLKMIDAAINGIYTKGVDGIKERLIVPMGEADIINAQNPNSEDPAVEVTMKTLIAGALGVTDTNISDARDRKYQMKRISKKFDVAFRRKRAEATKIMEKRFKAQDHGNADEVKKLEKEYENVIIDLIDFCEEHDTGLDLGSFNETVRRNATDNYFATNRLTKVKKAQRESASKVNKVIVIGR